MITILKILGTIFLALTLWIVIAAILWLWYHAYLSLFGVLCDRIDKLAKKRREKIREFDRIMNEIENENKI